MAGARRSTAFGQALNMNATVPIRVLLVDDHTVVRAGYRVLLGADAGIDIIAEAESGEQACQLFAELAPDVVVMDLSLKGMGGLEATRRINARDAQARVLIFSMHEDPAFVEQALKAGARGYITKAGAPEILSEAIHALMRDETYLEQRLREVLERQQQRDTRISQLSPREFDVLHMLAAGHSSANIAERLRVSEKTVANHRSQIRRKLQVRSDAELVLLAQRYGV